MKKAKKSEIGKYAISLLLAWMSIGCLYISNNTYVVLGDLNEKLGGGINGWLYKLQSGFQQMGYEACIIFVMLTFFFLKFLPTLEKELFRWSIPFAVGAAGCLLLSEAYYQDDSWDRVFGNTTAVLLSTFRAAGIAVLMFVLFHLVSRLRLELSGKSTLDNKRKAFWTTAGLIFLAWVPYLICMFPGIISSDAVDQFAQVLGRREYSWTKNTVILQDPNFLWNNSHPVFSTLLMGAAVFLGRLIGSNNWAMELYCVGQCAFFAMAVSYFLTYIRELGISKILYRCCFFFFALHPLFALWGVTIVKDTPFSFLMLLVVVGLLKVTRSNSEKIDKDCVYLMVSMFFFMLTRNNGFYLLLLSLLCAIPIFWKQKTLLKKLLLVFAVPMLVFQVGIQSILLPVCGIAGGGRREVFSVPSQQLARTIKEHNDFTEEEQAAIMAVYDFKGDKTVEQWVSRYLPDYADNARNCFDTYATKEELAAMMKVWMKGFFRHPLTYIEAVFNVNFGWFGLDNDRDGRFYKGEITEAMSSMLPGIEQPPELLAARKGIMRLVDLASKNPFTMWMAEYSLYTWIHIICLLLMLRQKKYQELFCTLVSYFNYLLLFAGPISYIRYALPMMVCTPLVIILTFAKKEVPAASRRKSNANICK